MLHQAAPESTFWQAGHDRDLYTVIITDYVLKVFFDSGQGMSADLYSIQKTDEDEKKYQHTPYRMFIVVALACLYFFVFESECHGCINALSVSKIAAVEVVDQAPFLKKNQTDPHNNSAALNPPDKDISAFLRADCKHRKRLVIVGTLDKTYFTTQHHFISVFHPIISILQKNNTWHGSAKDETDSKSDLKTAP